MPKDDIQSRFAPAITKRVKEALEEQAKEKIKAAAVAKGQISAQPAAIASQSDEEPGLMTKAQIAGLGRQRLEDLFFQYQQSLVRIGQAYEDQSEELQAQASEKTKILKISEAAEFDASVKLYSLANQALLINALHLGLHQGVVKRLVRLVKDPRVVQRETIDALATWFQNASTDAATRFSDGIIASVMHNAEKEYPFLTLDSTPSNVSKDISGPGKLPDQNTISEYCSQPWTNVADEDDFEMHGPSEDPGPATLPSTTTEAQLVLLGLLAVSVRAGILCPESDQSRESSPVDSETAGADTPCQPYSLHHPESETRACQQYPVPEQTVKVTKNKFPSSTKLGSRPWMPPTDIESSVSTKRPARNEHTGTPNKKTRRWVYIPGRGDVETEMSDS